MKWVMVFILFFGSFSFVFADTNGIWHNSEDIIGGVLGQDESNRDFTFMGDITANSLFIDGDDSSYTLDLSSRSSLNVVEASNFLDLQDNNFFINPAGTSQLSYLRARNLVDVDNSVYSLDPSSRSYLNYLNLGSPTQDNRLSVGGHILIESSAPTLKFMESDLANNNFQIRNNLGEFKIYESNDSWSNNQLRFIIASNGNVGIGTSSPSSKLDVNGDLEADDIYTNGDIVATQDYVDSLTLETTIQRNEKACGFTGCGDSWGVDCPSTYTRTGCTGTCFGDEADFDLSPTATNGCRVDANTHCVGGGNVTVKAICARIS